MGRLVREKQLAGYEVLGTILRNGFAGGLGGTGNNSETDIKLCFHSAFEIRNLKFP